MLKKCIILLFLMCCSACPMQTGQTSLLAKDNKKIYKSSVCVPEKSFPQMIMIPFFNMATQIVPSCQMYPKYKTSLAMIVFYQHWVYYFGDDDNSVKNMLHNVMIEWGSRKKTIVGAYDIDGVSVTSPVIVGLVKSENMIWVWRGYDYKIANSSLTHELVHLALRAKNGHGDSDHEGTRYKGWTNQHTEMIIKIKNVLLSFNI